MPANGRNLPAVVPAAPSRDTAIASNSGRRTSVSASKGGDHASSALAELKGRRASVRSVPATYKVQSGDTLTAIARKYDMDLDDLYAANGGADKLDTLRVGQVIRLSAPVAVASKSAPARRSAPSLASHTVQSGETAYAISRKYNITFAELAAVNGGAEALGSLSPGQVLKIPAGKTTAVAQNNTRQASPARRVQTQAPARKSASSIAEYSVQNGETLWSISRKFNMKPMELLVLSTAWISPPASRWAIPSRSFAISREQR